MGELAGGQRLQIMLTPRELRIVDSWRFARRMPSRAAAIRELLKRGIAAEGSRLWMARSPRISLFSRTRWPISPPAGSGFGGHASHR